MNKSEHKGDIVDYIQHHGTNERPLVVVHQANCMNTMGSGIAGALVNAFPEVRESDLATTKGDKSKLGTWSSALVKTNVLVCNAYGQYKYGRDKATVYTDYEALRTALTDIVKETKQHEPIYLIPKFIGAGLANGDHFTIMTIIDEVFANQDVVLIYN